MRIKIAQLFVRKPGGFLAKNTYLVCGIIKTDEPLETESTHLLTADVVNVVESRDVKMYSRGNSLDGIMGSPLWKVNCRED